MERSEGIGLGVATVAHIGLFALLSWLALSPPELPKVESDPIEVSLVNEVDLTSAAPEPAASSARPAAEPEPLPV